MYTSNFVNDALFKTFSFNGEVLNFFKAYYNSEGCADVACFWFFSPLIQLRYRSRSKKLSNRGFGSMSAYNSLTPKQKLELAQVQESSRQKMASGQGQSGGSADITGGIAGEGWADFIVVVDFQKLIMWARKWKVILLYPEQSFMAYLYCVNVLVQHDLNTMSCVTASQDYIFNSHSAN